MPTLNKYQHGRAPKGTAIHTTLIIYPETIAGVKTGRMMKQFIDGQYEPHGGNRYHMTKQEKKADKKAGTSERLMIQIRNGVIGLKPKGPGVLLPYDDVKGWSLCRF